MFFMKKKEKPKEELAIPKEEKKEGLISQVKGMLYGAAVHGVTRHALKTRMYFEHMFMLITLGDLLGIPILPPYYSLRILPYVVPQIKTWKRRMLKERDLTDIMY